MALSIRTRLIWPTVAVIGAIGLSACSADGGGSATPAASAGGGNTSDATASSNGALAVPADADEETKKQYVEQNALAACMRAKGFTYTPHIAQDEAGPLKDVDGQDYSAAKKFRSKYGFGVWAGAVYRHDPNVWNSEAYNKNTAEGPDTAYWNALTDAEKQEYNKALGKRMENGKPTVGGCLKDATVKAYGHTRSQTEIDEENAEQKERAQANQQALNGDAQLVALATQYASCLTKAGISVTTTQPTSIGDMVKFQVSSQTPSGGTLSLGKSEAITKLTQEVGLAKTDLECGKAFRAAYFPKLKKHPFAGLTG
ncbi:hypothetical protein AB0N88_05390 [Streptomyces sp. NPDC093516]|uniref:hypothetical protein n=1 Tax=Streptomyces sp. NPDC093516 TaxID=3155304 RepID=UPI00342EDEEB